MNCFYGAVTCDPKLSIFSPVTLFRNCGKLLIGSDNQEIFTPHPRSERSSSYISTDLRHTFSVLRQEREPAKTMTPDTAPDCALSLPEPEKNLETWLEERVGRMTEMMSDSVAQALREPLPKGIDRGEWVEIRKFIESWEEDCRDDVCHRYIWTVVLQKVAKHFSGWSFSPVFRTEDMVNAAKLSEVHMEKLMEQVDTWNHASCLGLHYLFPPFAPQEALPASSIELLPVGFIARRYR